MWDGGVHVVGCVASLLAETHVLYGWSGFNVFKMHVFTIGAFWMAEACVVLWSERFGSVNNVHFSERDALDNRNAWFLSVGALWGNEMHVFS